jgi:hypothetical protein
MPATVPNARTSTRSRLSPLTFERWDLEPQGDLRDFPSGLQPAPTERFGELPENLPTEGA